MQSKSKKLRIKCYSDAGHGWITCKIALLGSLGIADKITAFSHMRGDSAYLEEDCDAGTLINALKERGIEFELVEKVCNCDYSPIRSYPRWRFGG